MALVESKNKFFSLQEKIQFSKFCITAKLFPKKFEKPESVVLALQTGEEVGLTPMQSLQHVNIIFGLPSIDAKTMLAIVKSNVKTFSMKIIQYNEEGCEVEIIDPQNPILKGTNGRMTFRYDVDRAKKAGDWDKGGSKGFYQRRPKTQFWARVTTEWCNMLYPEVVGGMYASEVVEMFDERKIQSKKKKITQKEGSGIKIEPISIKMDPEPIPEKWVNIVIRFSKDNGIKKPSRFVKMENDCRSEFKNNPGMEFNIFAYNWLNNQLAPKEEPLFISENIPQDWDGIVNHVCKSLKIETQKTYFEWKGDCEDDYEVDHKGTGLNQQFNTYAIIWLEQRLTEGKDLGLKAGDI